jgi:GMP synthase (glutamine-hydrolysing)
MTTRVAFLQHSAYDLPGLLGERARQSGFATRSYRADHGARALPRPGSFDLLVVLGSVASANDRSIPWIEPERLLLTEAVASRVPVLGICFGGQLLAQVLGGVVRRMARPEVGWRLIDSADPERIPPGPWLVWHEDGFSAPPGAESVAETTASLHAFILGIHTGVQFHPEVTRKIVGHWVDHARLGGQLGPDRAAELLTGFDEDGCGPLEQTRRLFDGFVERAGLSERG